MSIALDNTAVEDLEIQDEFKIEIPSDTEIRSESMVELALLQTGDVRVP